MKMLRRLLVTAATALALTGVAAGTAVAAPGIPNIGPGSANIGGVRCIQSAYNYVAGTHLRVDGLYGPATTEATRNFQRFFGLSVDGVVGPDTGGLLGFVVDRKAGFGQWRLGGCYDFVPS